VEECVSSPLNVGSGFVECQHGVYPVPAPATSNLLEGVPIYSRHVAAELVTPTGAAILAAMADRFEPLGDMTLERVGYGAGTRDHGRFPNCLRVFLGEGGHARETSETVTVIETNIDDMSAGDLAWAAERLLAAGALDVVTLPALMKKGRPGHVLQVIGRPEDADRLARTVFAETTTIGLRTSQVARRVLDREIVEVPTRFGPVRVKVARTNGRVLNVSAEYEDCARLARQTGEPLRVIREETLGAYRARASDDDSGDNG
jgi:uncharacterized protein (TIGR00299 family) protein